MSQIVVTLPDGSSRAMPNGTAVRHVAEAISPRLAKAALAGVVDGRLVDLAFPLDKDATVRIVTPESPEAIQQHCSYGEASSTAEFLAST